MRNLVIGGIEIPLRASERLTQEYRPIEASTTIRMSNGALVKQVAWNDKVGVRIQGEGVIPAGLEGLDYSAPITVKCIEDRAVTSSSNVITVPVARRSDYDVEGRAIVGNRIVSTTVSLAGDVATLTVVAGATSYQAIYWPELVCYFEPPDQSGTIRGARHNWSLDGEQI